MTGIHKASGWTFQQEGLTNRPRLVLAVTLLLVVMSAIFAASTLRIDTDTTDMIAEDVSFRQNEQAFKRAFPAFKDTILAVIDGDTPEASEEAATTLAAALRTDTTHFLRVDLPGDDPFFRTNGLLYLDIDTLTSLSNRLAEAQPMLAALAADPNLRGLSDFIRLVLEKALNQAAAKKDLDRLFNDMATVTEAALAGKPAELSWRNLLEPGGLSSGKRRLILIEPALDYSSLTPGAEAIAALRETADQQRINEANGLRLRLTGSAVLEHEELQTASSGALFAGLFATAGIALLLIWGLGSVRLIAATLLTLLAGLIITAGLATLLIGRLNLISVTFAVLFVGLGVDFGIHLSLRYREAVAKGLDHRAALGEALGGVGRPLTLSAICAGLGFIAFVPTDYRGLAELGIISAGGMVVAWAMSLTLLPALLTLMPLPPAPLAKAPRPKKAAWTDRYANIILGLVLVLAVLTMPLLLKVSFDFNPLNLKDPASESVSTFLELERNPETTANIINVLAEDLADADRLAARLNALSETGDVITLKSFVPKDQEAKLDIIDEMAFFLGSLQPETQASLTPNQRREAFSTLLSALDMSSKDEDSGLDRLKNSLEAFAEQTNLDDTPLQDLERRLTRHLPGLLNRLDLSLQADHIDLDTLPGRIREQWISKTGQTRILVRPAIGFNDNKSIARFADAVLGAVPEATGTPIIITQAGRAVVGAFIEASWIALALITVMLLLILRRLSDVFLVLAPLALAILFTGGSSVLLGLKLNFANVIVLPLLLGLGVSGAIHVVMRRHQRQPADHPETDGSFAASSTPRAVFFSALTTIASFGSLAMSPHQGMASMGLLLTVAILWSLVCTLIILPALLSLFGSSRDLAA